MWNSLTLDLSPKMEREDEEIDFKIKANFTVAYFYAAVFLKKYFGRVRRLADRAFRCNLFAQRQQKVFPLQSLTLVLQVILFVAMV